MEFSKLNSERILQSHLECLAAASFCLTWCRVYDTARTRCRSSNENVHLCLRDLLLHCLSSQMQSQLWNAQSSEVKGCLQKEGWEVTWGTGGSFRCKTEQLEEAWCCGGKEDSRGLRALADCLLLDFVLLKQLWFYKIYFADHQCLPTLLGFIAFFLTTYVFLITPFCLKQKKPVALVQGYCSKWSAWCWLLKGELGFSSHPVTLLWILGCPPGREHLTPKNKRAEPLGETFFVFSISEENDSCSDL